MPGRCPHLDNILGVTESITRRDFLDGVLLASGTALTASAVSPLAVAQESQTPVPGWNGYTGEGKAGLHVETIRMLHERKVAAFFPDGDGETVPSNVEGVLYPIHALQIASMGMVCADSLQFEELIEVCEEEQRWEFMVVGAPLRLPGGTGSLFNPIAVF